MIPPPIPTRDAPTTTRSADPVRSHFVSVVAVAFILLSGYSFLVVALRLMTSAQPLHDAPRLTAYLVMLIASIGLFHRHEWCRKLFIAMMGIYVVWQLVGMSMARQIQTTYRILAAILAPAAATGQGESIATGVGIAMSVLLCALCVWIIVRLSRASVRAEFAATTM